MYTKDEIIDLAHQFTERRVSKPDLLRWLDLEIQQIVNEKRWWWRRKSFSQVLTAGTATYNLGRAGTSPLNKADDLESVIILFLVDSSGNVSELYYTSDPIKVAQILANTSSDTPCYWTFEPGTTKTIRLDKKPLAAETMYGVYWAGFNPTADLSDQAIPLIPETYHYVPLKCLVRTMFAYLYGQKDARYAVAEQHATKALEQLRGYNEPGARQAIELRDVNPASTVRATD